MSEETQDKSELLTFAFADNTFDSPVECIRHVFKELIKVGHTVRVYTYARDNYQHMADLEAFMMDLEMPELVIENRDAVGDADVYYDARCFQGAPGFWVLYGALLKGEIIISLQHNMDIFSDQLFWQTGKRGSGIVTREPKIIGLHDN